MFLKSLLSRINLQLFAGEGSGGDGGDGGAATGVESAAAGRDQLLALGVPEAVINKREKRASRFRNTSPANYAAPSQTDEPAAEDGSQEQTPTAETDTPAPEPEKKVEKPSWDEIMKDPDYNRQMQMTIQSRLRSAKDAEANLNALRPALEVQARYFEMDPNNLDYAALAGRIIDQDQYYEEMALRAGTSVEVAKKADQQDRANARQQKLNAEAAEQKALQDHFNSLMQQGEEMKKTFPNFDLQKELLNPEFTKLTHPSMGFSVDRAYRFIHQDEIQASMARVISETAAQKTSAAIQSGTRRPVEAGASGQAPSGATFNPQNMSKKDREAFKAYVRSEALAGRKVYPST